MEKLGISAKGLEPLKGAKQITVTSEGPFSKRYLIYLT